MRSTKPDGLAAKIRASQKYDDLDLATEYQRGYTEGYASGARAGLPDGPDLVFSTSPAPEGIDTDCMFVASPGRVSVHISRRAINAQIERRSS